ncbi:MAG: Maf family protein [Xanthomonadaceae bacterium]|jgi:septum formation protein|nr:Maf family protein [Xanthomonadaceae bacterium]
MLFLASQSPRRRQLLAQLGFDFSALDVEVPEVVAAGEPAEDYVRRVAREKAGAGLLQVAATPGAVVLGADTEVVLDGEVFGKPADAAEAARMLRRLAGRPHEVLTALCCASAAREETVLHRSRVHVAALDDAELADYLAGGEWRGKAGAYAIQGRAGAFIPHLEGSFTGVMGLPLHECAGLLRRFGLRPVAAPAT